MQNDNLRLMTGRHFGPLLQIIQIMFNRHFVTHKSTALIDSYSYAPAFFRGFFPFRLLLINGGVF